MTDNNELTPPGRPVGGTEVGNVNPEGSRLDGIPPITESRELRSAPPGWLLVGMLPKIELTAPGRPDGTADEGIPPMTDNNELTPPGRPVGGTDVGNVNPEGSRLDGIPPITESRELRSP
jgi:hypothetical protein